MAQSRNRIRVLVVDDSALVRQVMQEILTSDPNIEVMAAVSNPFAAAEKMREEVPDVITLDIEMPHMDGLMFLEKIMTQHPIPVVICSSLAESNSETALKALEYGAVEIIQKPRLGMKQFFEESKVRICDAVKAASAATVKLRPKTRAVEPKLTADAIIEKPNGRAMIQTTEKVVVVGASTGGTEALKVFLEMVPPDGPAIAVVQHMPEHFTSSFAKRLDALCRVSVKEAENNDTLMPGRTLIAPGNRHMLLKRSGARYYVELRDGPLVSRHRPSVDVLFRSAARYAGRNAVGVIMTGMGDDGARGLLEMKTAGAFTIAQDEQTCVVFGMPHEAIRIGAVDRTLPLERIFTEVLRQCR
jgi:two-component system, chemotaxis family, protein-glutamate methylesterase/glutaminase